MKKILGLLVLMIVFIVGCSSNESSNTNSSSGSSDASSNSNSEEVIELSLNTWYPTSDPFIEAAFGKWEDYVEEKTNGRVVIQSYHANQLGTADTMLPDLIGGVYDIGTVSPILFDDTEMFPYTISNLAFAIPDAKIGSNVMRKFLDKYNEVQEIEVLGTGNSDAYVIWSTKPIRSIEDVKGKKIRAISDVHIDLVKSWGASPVATPVADIYEAFQKGSLDAAVFSLVGAASWNYHEVAPYITNIAISTPTFMPSMNKDTFNSLPEDIQTLFKEDFGPKLAELWGNYYYESTTQLIEEHPEKTKGKGEVITLSPEDAKPFQSLSKDIWDTWVKDANEKGFPGEEMLSDFKKFIVEEGGTLPFEE